MAKQIKYNNYKKVYFGVGIIVFILFFSTALYIRHQVIMAASERSRLLAINICENDINAIKETLHNYFYITNHFKDALEFVDNNKINEAITHIKNKNKIISEIEIIDNDTSISGSKIYKDSLNIYYIKLFKSINKKKKLVIKVKLIDIYKNITASRASSHSYVTISKNGRYIYHPDENKLGKTSTDSIIKTNKYRPGNLNVNVYSNYLQINVFRYYITTEINGDEYLFTSSVPDLGINQFISGMANNFIIFALIALFALIIIFILGIYRWRKEFIIRQHAEKNNLLLQLKNEHQKQTVIETELEVLKSGLNPHFLFNSLSSLRILVEKDANIAKEFAVTLSKLYRYLLRQEKLSVVNLKDELTFVNDYLKLQQIRFGDKITYSINIAKTELNKKIPPVSIQLLVENCIKHTAISSKKPLSISIFTKENYVIVENNYSPCTSFENNTGIGLTNLQKRYSFITDKKCSFEIKNEKYIAKIPFV